MSDCCTETTDQVSEKPHHRDFFLTSNKSLRLLRNYLEEPDSEHESLNTSVSKINIASKNFSDKDKFEKEESMHNERRQQQSVNFHDIQGAKRTVSIVL